MKRGMYMRSYLVVFTDKPSEPVDVKEAREVIANNHREAAQLALTMLPRPSRFLSMFHRGETVRAWVWADDSPRHDNGMPICVHGMDIVRGIKMAPAGGAA